jgi:hypothetical protein
MQLLVLYVGNIYSFPHANSPMLQVIDFNAAVISARDLLNVTAASKQLLTDEGTYTKTRG